MKIRRILLIFLSLIMFLKVYADDFNKKNSNERLSIEYVNKLRKKNFVDAYLANIDPNFSIFPDYYNLVFVLFDVENYNYFNSRINDDEKYIKIYNSNGDYIKWNYVNFVKQNNINMNSECEVVYSFLGYNWCISKALLVSVINADNKVYLITLLDNTIGTVFECNFETHKLDEIKTRKIPFVLLNEDLLKSNYSQTEAINKLFSIIMKDELSITIKSTVIDDNKLNPQSSRFVKSNDIEMKSTSYLIEGKVEYNIQNAKEEEGLPFVPAKGNTYSNIICLKSYVKKNYGLIIQNGYISAERLDLFEKNSRVKTLKIKYKSQESDIVQIVELKDNKTLQFVPFMWVLIDDCKEVQIQIDSVYEGNKYDDVCINYLCFVSENTNYDSGEK